MKKSLVKVMAMLLLAVMVASLIVTSVLASGYDGLIEQINNGDDTSGAKTSVLNIVASILSITKVIGVGVAVIMLIVLAIKYISASPGDKADIKKHATVYVVGACVLFGSAGILQIIQKFVEANIKASE